MRPDQPESPGPLGRTPRRRARLWNEQERPACCLPGTAIGSLSKYIILHGREVPFESTEVETASLRLSASHRRISACRRGCDLPHPRPTPDPALSSGCVTLDTPFSFARESHPERMWVGSSRAGSFRLTALVTPVRGFIN